MCGILCEICYKESYKTTIKDENLLERVRHRGPDNMQTVVINPSSNISISLTGAVLWMQGPQLTPQPIENEKGILLYNGDIFDDTWSADASDTQIIMNKLNTRSNDDTNDMTEKHITETLKSLKGPFSLLYYDKNTQDLYISRDRIGRSSMLLFKNDYSIVLSSVLGRDYECIEVPATNIYRLNINTHIIKAYSWNGCEEPEEYILDCWLQLLKSQQSLPDDAFMFDFDNNDDYSDSGDIIPFVEEIAVKSYSKLEIMKQLMSNEKIHETVLKTTKLLEKSVNIRLKRQPNICKDCLESDRIECEHCTVGVLFSGGLDCTVLALLADTYLPKEQSIDLINVAFKKDENSTFDVPDRITGRQSYEELKKLRPARRWTFHEINVTKEELKECQATTIADLVYPRQTILDESLGSALWFAARGKDFTSTSPCRVLLLGSGADELFGGYTRHRNVYKRQSWRGLARELQLDWKRISFRNLSRDNRVICDHGRQPRMPYLDEEFTQFVLQLRPWFKCIPSENLGPGMGDKLMLRLVAYNLGLSEVVVLPKRALQFGSRIANNKEKGSDISKSFLIGNNL